MFYPIHIVVFLVSAAFGSFGTPELAVDRAANLSAQACEIYPTLAEETSAEFCSRPLSACADGVVYSDPKSGNELWVPWNRIVHWRLDETGPSTVRSDPPSTFRLKLTESRGLFASRASHDFLICGTSEDRRDLERMLKEQFGLLASR